MNYYKIKIKAFINLFKHIDIYAMILISILNIILISVASIDISNDFNISVFIVVLFIFIFIWFVIKYVFYDDIKEDYLRYIELAIKRDLFQFTYNFINDCVLLNSVLHTYNRKTLYVSKDIINNVYIQGIYFELDPMRIGKDVGLSPKHIIISSMNDFFEYV
jgi:energy-coupling factor transporter transmembrane protein EcfT